MPSMASPERVKPLTGAADFIRMVLTIPPLTDAERATLAVLVEQSRPTDLGDHAVPMSEISAVVGADDFAAISAAVFSLVGRRTESPPESGDGPWSAEVLVSGVCTEGSLCRVAWGPAMRAYVAGCPSSTEWSAAERARLAEFGLTDPQIDAAVALAAEHGAERVERNLAYVEAEIARGREIEVLGAYTHRAVQGDWGGRAGIAARKRDTVRRAAAVQLQTAWRSLFPPPALGKRRGRATAKLSPGLRGTDPQPTLSLPAKRADAPRGEHSVRHGSARDDAGGAARVPAPVAGPVRGPLLRSVLVLAALVVGCSSERHEPASNAGGPSAGPVAGPTATAELVGVWDLAEVLAEFGECHEASIGYRADGRYVAKSGGQVVTGIFEAEELGTEASGRGEAGTGVPSGAPARRRYLVSQRVQAHNGRPNCQGIAADVAVAVSPREAVVDVRHGSGGQPDEAWVYFNPDARSPASVLVRRSSAQPERHVAGAAFPQLP